MVNDVGAMFLAVGPPIILAAGVTITIMLVSRWRGRRRWLVLIFGPAVTLFVSFVAMYLVVLLINPPEGSGFLLGGTVMVVYFLALMLYYPILIVIALVQYVTMRRTQPPVQQ